MNTINTRLRDARMRAGFSSARSAAIKHGWNVSTYAAHENGQNGFSGETALEYAQAFGTSATWILFGRKAKSVIEITDAIPLVGSLISGNWLDIKSDWRQDGMMAAVNLNFPDQAVAFSIDSQSMWPRFNSGDIIVCTRYYGVVDQLISDNEEIVAKLVDDRMTIATAFKTSKGGSVFDLHSHNAPVMREAELKGAFSILAILPRKRWKGVRASEVSSINLQNDNLTDIRKAIVALQADEEA